MGYRQKKSLPSASSDNFNDKVKEIIEMREGVRSGWGPAFVTFDELKNHDFISSLKDKKKGPLVITDGKAPSPPTNLQIEPGMLGNVLTWNKSVSTDVWYYEVWVSNNQNRSNANLLATVTHPNESYRHGLGATEVLLDHYYWIRAVSWGGMYSIWEPPDAQGGYLVEGQTSYSEMTSEMLEVLQNKIVELDENHFVKNPYGVHDNTFYIALEGEEGSPVYPFMAGIIEGQPTVGINGRLVVDGSIYADAIGADQIKAHHIKANQIDATHIQSDTIRADMYHELRNTIVYNETESLDSAYPFEMPFKIVSELNAIVSVKLSFKISDYRAYSKNAETASAQTSGASSKSTSDGGGSGYFDSTDDGGGTRDTATSGVGVPDHKHEIARSEFPSSTEDTSADGYHNHNINWGYSDPVTKNPYWNDQESHSHSISLPDHAHGLSLPDHTHGMNHTHSVPAHNHDIVHGIFNQAFTGDVEVFVNNGSGFTSIGTFSTDQTDIDVTQHFSGSGWKSVRFDSTGLCRIHAVVEIKLDIDA